MSKHTKGPWKVKEFGIEGQERFKILADGQFICQTGEESRLIQGLYTTRANAHLIAAAPELLDALNELLYVVNTFHNGQTDLVNHYQRRAVIAAEKAIYKAEGGAK